MSSLADRLKGKTLRTQDAAFLKWQAAWLKTARPQQMINFDFTECGIMAGRGYGKTRVGAEWLAKAVYLDTSGFDSCVIAPTYQDVKFTCFEGESGLMSVIPPELIHNYNKSDMVIEMFNISGGISAIRGFTAEKPERLRGPQHCRAWGDELAAWFRDEDTWDMMQMGLRLGEKPQVLWTTTPKPKDLIRKLTAPKPGRVIVTGSTYDNKANLPTSFFEQLLNMKARKLDAKNWMGS